MHCLKDAPESNTHSNGISNGKRFFGVLMSTLGLGPAGVHWNLEEVNTGAPRPLVPPMLTGRYRA